MKKYLALVWMGVLALSTASMALETSDRELMLERGREWFANDYVSADALASLRTQKQDGTWENIKYKKGSTPMDHLTNIRAMAIRYHQEKNGALKDSLKSAVILGLTYWYDHNKDFVNDNWWTNDVGVMLEINPVAFLLWNELPQNLQQKIIASNPEKSSGNATNKSWLAENVVIRGILESRDSLITQGIRDIAEGMSVTKKEGHQKDHSFFMHGNLLYNGGYGKVSLAISAKWAVITRGTPFAFSDDALSSMASLALDGSRWMMWKDMVDPMIMGREISRKAGNKNATGWLPILKDLMKADPSRQKDYAGWANSIETKTDKVLRGCHYFNIGEMMVCRSNDFYTSLMMSSWRNFGSEFLNRENKKGLWLGMGVLSLYKTPDDYKNIQALWDWSRLPGTTTFNESELTEKRITNNNNYAGGLTNGNFGVAAMISDRPKLYSQKSWYFIGDKIVALGSYIESSHDSPISTTIDQRLVHSKVLTTKGDVKDNTPVETNRVWCDGIGYASLDNAMFKVTKQKKTGNWRDIGTLNEEESANVLTIEEDHGVKPQTGSYAYLIDFSANRVKFFRKRYSFLFANTNDYHAVYDKASMTLAGAVFGKSEIKLNKYSLSFSEPCIFYLQKTKDQYALTLMEPTRKKESLEVSVDVSGDKSPDFGKTQKVAFDKAGTPVNLYFSLK